MDAILRWLEDHKGSHVIDAIRKLQKELHQANHDADIARRDRDAALEAAHDARASLREMQQELSRVTGELEAEMSKVGTAMAYRVKLEKRLNDLEHANGKLQDALDEAESSLKQSTSTNAQLHELLDAEKARCEMYQGRISAIADFAIARK